MKSNQTSPLSSIELDLIQKDTSFYLEFVTKLSKFKSSSIFLPNLMPYISLFSVETDDYLTREYPSYTSVLSGVNFEPIRSSRMRVKLLDDNQKNVDGIFELTKFFLDLYYERFINEHTGFLAFLKRFLACDFGVFFYNGHIIGSTHTSMINLGFEKKDLLVPNNKIGEAIKKKSYSTSYNIGQHLSSVLKLPEISQILTEEEFFTYGIQDHLLGYNDKKSQDLLAVIFNKNGTEYINLTLLLFLCHTNFLQYVLDNLIIKEPYTLFKLKYITLYHLFSSFKKLQNYARPKNLLTFQSMTYLQEIIGDKELKEYSDPHCQDHKLAKIRDDFVA